MFLYFYTDKSFVRLHRGGFSSEGSADHLPNQKFVVWARAAPFCMPTQDTKLQVALRWIQSVNVYECYIFLKSSWL